MTIANDVLEMFRDEILTELDDSWKEIPLELDSDLFDALDDDLHSTLDRYEKEFNVDLSCVNWRAYFPWQNTPLLTQQFKARREEMETTHLPFTVRMLAESAAVGEMAV